VNWQDTSSQTTRYEQGWSWSETFPASSHPAASWQLNAPQLSSRWLGCSWSDPLLATEQSTVTLQQNSGQATIHNQGCSWSSSNWEVSSGGDNVTARAPVPSATCGVIPFTRAPPNKGNNKGDFVDSLCQKQRERSGAIVEARSAQRYMVLCSMFSRW